MASNDSPRHDQRQSLKGSFNISGSVHLEGSEASKPDVQLHAYAFSPVGEPLGKAGISADGKFSLNLSRQEVAGPLQLVIGPEGDPNAIRSSASYKRTIGPQDWKEAGGKYSFNPEIRIPISLWPNWLRTWVCVGGRVQKQYQQDGIDQLCPVPFVKVEVFDVDREWCWPWPWLLSIFEQKPNLAAARLPELVAEVPHIPHGPGDPGPLALSKAPLLNPGAASEINPQPLPPRELSAFSANAGMSVDFSSQQAQTQAGLATLTSRIPFWEIFPRCFYSKQLVCTTYTDCDGYFECCFPWWIFHVRNGRFRLDPRPDIIIRVTQVINGVEKVIYMDPFANIRWNVTNTFINLVLDDPDIECGNGCQTGPEGTTIFYTRVGNDYVYEIEQAGGTYHGGGFSNMAYGTSLYLTAAIGKGLTESANPYYYRVSVSKNGGAFNLLSDSLSDTRVDKISLQSESYVLGPNVINGVPGLYEIRNTKNYYWYFPDLVSVWNSAATEPDHGTYTVRLEVYDHNGVKQTSATVDYRDGTVAPPATLPTMPDHIDLVLSIDNKPAVLSLDVPAALNDCGVVPFSSTPFDIDTSVNQPNGHLYSWQLNYEKGLVGTQFNLNGEASAAGLSPLPRNATTSSDPFTNGLSTTCAFSLILNAWAHIRNGYGLVYFSQLIKSVAVEKCPGANAVIG